MNNLILPITAIILVSLIVYLIKNIIPVGVFKKTLNLACGILIMYLMLQMVTGYSIDIPAHNATNSFNTEYIKKGIELHTRQCDGFNNAQVYVEFKNDDIATVKISAYRTDSSNAIDFEKNKSVLINALSILYKIDKNNIFIEVI